jgi:hypothetical protein
MESKPEVVDQIHTGRYYVQRFLARKFGFEVDDIKEMSEVKVVDKMTFSKMALVSYKSSWANRKASSLKATCSLSATLDRSIRRC